MHEVNRKTAPVASGNRSLHDVRIEAEMLRRELSAEMIGRAVRQIGRWLPRRTAAAA